MTPSAVALGIAGSMVACAIVVGLLGGRHKLPNPSEFLVAGRSMGALLLWLLLAGEFYTAFTFLGAAGWAYGRGAPVYYIICYGPVAYIIGYFVMPLAWNAAKRFGMLTLGDFFAVRYGSKALGAFVAVVGFIFLIPYITLQMNALQILLNLAGYGAVNAQNAVFVAVIAIALFVFVTGLRGTAWTSVVKDALVLAGVAFAGIVLPIHFFGSPAAVIAKVEALKPGFLALSTTDKTYNLTWFISTVSLNGIAFFLFPHTMMSTFSAKSAGALRSNYIFLPFYQLMIVLMIFAGLTALLVVPGLSGPAADNSFVLVVAKYYPPWVLGFIAGAGCLAALVPVTAHLLGASGLVVKNVVTDLCAWNASERARTMMMRALVLILAGAALVVWATLKTTLVEFLLIVYNGMAQFVPGFFAAFWWRRINAWGVAAGIAAGVAVAVWAVVAQEPALYGINIGVVALAVNLLAAVVVSLSTPAPDRDRVERFIASANVDAPA